MPLFVGSGTTSGGGFEAQSSQAGIPTALTDPQSANVGDVYIQSVGSGATMKLYDGSSWNRVGADTENIVPFLSGGDPYAPTDGLYEVRVFTSPGTLSVSSRSVNADAIIIAGGGGAGTSSPTGSVNNGGGGGGGAISTSVTLSPGSYPIIVGAGGSGGFVTPTILANMQGCPGGDSIFCGNTACGGGGGGAPAICPGSKNGLPGGSGGGGGSGFGPSPAGTGGVCVAGQGCRGFAGAPTYGGAGGGFGACGCAQCPGCGGLFNWDLPTSFCKTTDCSFIGCITRFSGGGATCPTCPNESGYGGGGVGGTQLGNPGESGAVFIRFKKCQ